MREKKKQPAKKTTKKPSEKTGRKNSAVGKIYKTTDGFFNNKPLIKKPRNVAAIDQRKMDGAVAVVWTIVKEIDRKKRKERTVLKKSFLWGGV